MPWMALRMIPYLKPNRIRMPTTILLLNDSDDYSTPMTPSAELMEELFGEHSENDEQFQGF